MTKAEDHRPFALVLAGGGARGFAHAGVLRALEHLGYRPKAIVGVSMGAVVAVTYALNPDWYRALKVADIRGLPDPPKAAGDSLTERIRALLASERMLQDMLLGWGVGARSLEWGQTLLRSLTLGKTLQQGRVRVATVATDLCAGRRVVFEHGSAADAAYASSALAGIFPPLIEGDRYLADGCYTDLVPIDIARGPDCDLVIAVNPQLDIDPSPPRNGIQAMLKAMDICAHEHARLRFGMADFVIQPEFPFAIDTLEFRFKRLCIAAGMRAVFRKAGALRALLNARTHAPSR